MIPSIKFREEALMDCGMEEKAGIFTLTDRLKNICFVQVLYTDRIRQSSTAGSAIVLTKYPKQPWREKVLLFTNR
jgi:hypothetical protein